MRAAALALSLALLVAAAPASAATRRFAVVAGASLGGPGRVPLRYATSDAREVSGVLQSLGGVARADLVLVEEPDADRLRAALAAVAGEAARARAPGLRVEVLLYYSGHSDGEGLLLGGSRLPYAELRRALGAVAADVRVAILDSCASGAFTRTKGGVHRPPFLLDRSSRVQGHAFLTSSAEDEASQESDRLRASFFTHALLTGLRGAADASGDSLVTLNEAYQFAFRETLARTETTRGGPQHPGFDIALVGSGEVVMTDLRLADAVLVVPEAVDGQVFVRNPAGQLVVELRKVRGARIEVALEAGRYDVRVTRDRRVLAGQVVLPRSGQIVLDEGQLAIVELEETASRGELALPAAPAIPGPPPLSAPPAPAERRPARGAAAPYLLVRGGAAAGQSTLRGEWAREAELALGVWVHRIVALELAGGYSEVSGDQRGMLPGDGISRDGIAVYYDPDAAVRDRLTAIPFTATVKVAVPAGAVRPYLLGGLGMTLAHLEREPGEDYVWLAPGAERQEDDDAVLGFHFGVGAAIELGQRLFATLETRYVSTLASSMLRDELRLSALHVHGGLGVSF